MPQRPSSRLILSLLLALLLPLAALAQRPLTGRVLAHATKEPLPQVTVRVEGQPAGTTTDQDGRFRLTLPAAATALTFSCLGYQSLTVPAAQLGPEVVLSEQTYLIGEVQVSYVQLQKLLLREWRIAPESLDAATNGIIARAKAKPGKSADFVASRPESVRKVMESARFEFRPNGVVKTKMMMLGSKMRWQLDEDTRTLTVVNDDGTERKIRVVELTAERLVLRNPSATGEGITYVPAK